MGRLRIPISDDRKIRKQTTNACQQVGAAIAVAAGQMAGGKYGVETSQGTDRPRVNVYAEDGPAIAAEKGATPPLQRAALQAEHL
ncbi:hypothetical protein SEA_CAMBIARE_12 [Mycobacterium phage Cambiare]|uniref:Head-to-tail connector protein n=2 Tax=Avocadovirus TaxID=2946813 RepID=A0A222YZ69_9CAUD|nr:hypothetical protein AVT48_gp12 [Mycobacterium phage Cambiare]YP_010051483.1 head-to-tail connector protein [Mycobacterium phage Avocado]AKF14514.1 hypothetical protein SEA_CAMBIARE_12 [Mycobacterium phage Cambiare]ASR77213.1 hypothetical protein SEA_AVOCADO_11 [Mycobacterium phage Avocado]